MFSFTNRIVNLFVLCYAKVAIVLKSALVNLERSYTVSCIVGVERAIAEVYFVGTDPHRYIFRGSELTLKVFIDCGLNYSLELNGF